ncbi:MAG TPA: hypothetical protein VFW11_10805 [Cyclobacteriaceae bacterium]|nr:hypothetical protein [Cyclobacteriaceae bacterium]
MSQLKFRQIPDLKLLNEGSIFYHLYDAFTNKRMRKFHFTFLILLVIACGSKHPFDHQFFFVGKSRGIVDREINEASGLAASKSNPGMLWTHNDSGNDAAIFLIDEHGKLKARVNFPNLVNRDWEDIAVGPGPQSDTTYVYIGEIGDNFSRHLYKYIYRLKEPKIHPGDKVIQLTINATDSIKFDFPDGPRDSEALMIDPLTKDIYVFSKRETNVNLYVLPFPQSTTNTTTAQFVLRLPLTQINAADISPDGKEILIKNYTHVYYWQRKKGESIKDILNRKPAFPPYITEPQGESITFDRSGRGYFTLSEETNGKSPHLMFYQRKN